MNKSKRLREFEAVQGAWAGRKYHYEGGWIVWDDMNDPLDRMLDKEPDEMTLEELQDALFPPIPPEDDDPEDWWNLPIDVYEDV